MKLTERQRTVLDMAARGELVPGEYCSELLGLTGAMLVTAKRTHQNTVPPREIIYGERFHNRPVVVYRVNLTAKGKEIHGK